MKRLISVFLIIGLVITAMPAFAVTADAASIKVTADSGGAQYEIIDENALPSDNQEGATPPREGGNTEQVDIETIDPGNGSNVTYTEKTVKVRPDHIGVHQSTNGSNPSDGLIPMNSLTEIYLIFNTDSEAAADPDGDDEIPYISFGELLGLDNIQSAQLSFSTTNNNADFQFDIYPLAVPFKTKAGSSFQWTDTFKESFTFEIADGLQTRERLSATQQRDNDEIMFDIISDIKAAQGDSLSSAIFANHYYGYALTLMQGDAYFGCSNDNMPELTVTYLQEEERTPTETDLAAADEMLAQRELLQADLEGSGTVEDPYRIYDVDDLQGMAENDNSCYILMNDIDLEGHNWRPPGYYYWYPFMGYLDGNGHTIKNLHVGGTSDDAWNTNAGGLFGYFEGRVENLHVETAQGEGEGVDFFGYSGGIAGVANAPAEIINCSFNGYVSGNGSVGGLVGIAYPGVIIENCAALGTVDASIAFAYMRDNGMTTSKEIIDVGYEVLVYILKICVAVSGLETQANMAEGQSYGVAVFNTIWSKVKDLPVEALMNTDTMKAQRKSYIGGLVGLNYGEIRNSYSSTEIKNIQSYLTGVFDTIEGWFGSETGSVTYAADWAAGNRLSKLGGLVGYQVEGYGEEINSYYNKDKGQGGDIGEGKTTSELKDEELFEGDSMMHGGNATDQWDYHNRSTDGLPLPKFNEVKRKGSDSVYYNSRVLMKTRPDFIIGEPVVKIGDGETAIEYVKLDNGWHKIDNGVASASAESDDDTITAIESGGEETGAIYCTDCHDLYYEYKNEANSGVKEELAKQIAVTGMYQRGSDARPYHVHDIDSLLAMQDSKESHFILCSDIDFKLKKDGTSIQKYWWPAGKSHTSPIKGSLKGNAAYSEDNSIIYDDISARTVSSEKDRFTIKNLTVQSNRHVGLFACFRGTFSDINIQLPSLSEHKNWKDGIRTDWEENDNKMIAGLFTIGNKASAGAVAGETVNGAKIKNCIVTGPGNDLNSSEPESRGIIKGALRTGAIVGLNNRGCTVENCKSYVYTDSENYETAYLEDTYGAFLEIYQALVEQADEWKNLAMELFSAGSKVNADSSKWNKFKEFFKNLGVGNTEAAISSVANGPVVQWVINRYGNVCAGGLVGENSGTVKNCTAHTESVIDAGEPFSGWILAGNHSSTVGRSNANSTEKNNTTTDWNFESVQENNTNNIAHQVDEKDFSGGDGTAESPYEIRSIAELERVKKYLKSGFHFRLMSDLDFEEEEYEGNWVAIGTDADYFAFQGVFDGNGYTISNLTMNSGAAAGLFGYCAGTIKNLKVKNFNIDTTGASAGGIVAELCAGGRIEQCAVENSTVNSAHYSGGIAGAAYKGSVINNVYADGVSCSLSHIMQANTGTDPGLGGSSGDGLTLNNFQQGWDFFWEVADFIGAIPGLGSADDKFGKVKTFINKIIDEGSNIRTAAAGGIVGFLGGELSNSWVDRRTNFSDGAAGLLKQTIGSFYTAYQGDLVGRDFYGKITGKNYVLESTADSIDGIRPVGSDYAPGKFDKIISGVAATKVTEDEIEVMRFNYAYALSGLDGEKWSPRRSSASINGQTFYKYGLKALRDDGAGAGAYLSTDDAKLDYEIIAKVPAIDKEDGFYMITNVNELAYVEYEGWSDYKLMNDIDLTGYNWAPLCREHDQYFDGTFDGQGHTIYGLNVETNENGGLFGFILGDVMDLTIGVEKVDAYASAGGLAAGIYYPAEISRVAVVENDIAIAMAGERLFNEAFEEELDKPLDTSYVRGDAAENFMQEGGNFETFRDVYDYYHSDEFDIARGTNSACQTEKDNFILSIKASALKTLVEDMDNTEHPADIDPLEQAGLDAKREVFRSLLGEEEDRVLNIAFSDWLEKGYDNIYKLQLFEGALTALHERMVSTANGKESLNGGAYHIVGGGNDDGAGVGGLAGIVGKDVLIENCYSRVNVSNGNFVKSKELDTMGYVMGLIRDSATIVGHVYEHRQNQKSRDENRKKLENRFEEHESNDDFLHELNAAVDLVKEFQSNNGILENVRSHYYGNWKTGEKDFSSEDLSYFKYILSQEISKLNDEDKKKKLEEIRKNVNTYAPVSEVGAIDAQSLEAYEKIKDNLDVISELDPRVKEASRERYEEANKLLKARYGQDYDLDKKVKSDIEEREADNAKNNNKDIADATRANGENVGSVWARMNAVEWMYLILDLVKDVSDMFFNVETDFYDSAVGGLVGESRGKLVNCYSISTIKSDFSGESSILWGLVDLFDVAHEGRLVGRVRNGDNGGGIGQIGTVQQQVVNCYYYGGYNIGKYSYSEGLGNPCKTLEYWEEENKKNGSSEYNPMQNPSTFSGFDFAKTWKPGAYGGYPELIYPDDPYLDGGLSAGFTRDLFYGEGSGTKEDPYIIKTESQFLQIAQMRQAEYYYRLDADLDLTFTVGDMVNAYKDGVEDGKPVYSNKYLYNKASLTEGNIFFGGSFYGGYNGAGWYDQYKESTDPTKEGDAFAGHFDGNGHRITFCNKVTRGQYEYHRQNMKENGEITDGTNVKKTSAREEGYYAGGLFPLISGSVKNLEVVCEDEGHSKARYNGVLAGRLLSGGVVENVSVTYSPSDTNPNDNIRSQLEGRLAVGGLIGSVDENATVVNCAFYYNQPGKEIPFSSDHSTHNTAFGELKGDAENIYIYNNGTSSPSINTETEGPEGFDMNCIWVKDSNTGWYVLRCLHSIAINGDYIKLDLGEGILINKITLLMCCDDEEKEKHEWHSEKVIFESESGEKITNIEVPTENASIKIDFTSENGSSSAEYVFAADFGADSAFYLGDLISSFYRTAEASTKDGNSGDSDDSDNRDDRLRITEETSILYDVSENSDIISLYERNTPKAVSLITQTEHTGTDIEKVRIHYTDRIFDEVGTKQAKVTGFKSNVTTRQKVTVEYKGKTYETYIQLQPGLLWQEAVTMDIAEMPDKLTYGENEKIDLTGMKITLNKGMADECTRNIEELFRLSEDGTAIYQYGTKTLIEICGPESYDQKGTYNVTLMINGKPVTGAIQISVEEKAASIEVIKPAMQSVITNENRFSLKGGILRVKYFDGSTEEVDMTEATYTLSEAQNGSKTVTVEYLGCTDNFQVSYRDMPHFITSISRGSSGQTEYYEGETFNAEGFDFLAHYNDLDTQRISLEQIVEDGGVLQYDMSLSAGKSSEEKTVTLTYNGFTITFTITVSKSSAIELTPEELYVDNDADAGHGFAAFNLSSIQSLLADRDIEIKKATLKYKARAKDNEESSLCIREAEEKDIADWAEDEPEMYDILSSISLESEDLQEFEADVTAYITERLDGGSATFGFASADNDLAAVLETEAYEPVLIIDIGAEQSTLLDALTQGVKDAICVRRHCNGYEARVQVGSTGYIAVKNNDEKDNPYYTRHGYLTFDLEQLKEELTAKRLEIASASLSFGAKMDRENVQRTLYLHGVNAEKETWSYWNDKPELTAAIASDLIEGDELQTVSRDVTAYLKESLDGDQVTFGLTASECDGELIQVAAGGEYAPQLVIYTRAAQQ